MDAERIVRSWLAVETFNPRPLPVPDSRENVADVGPGEPLPWESGSRLAVRQPSPGMVWRHQVFGGLFELCRIRDALVALYGDDDPDGACGAEPVRGESALFGWAVDADGAPLGEAVLSECAWALGQAAAAGGDPGTWLAGFPRTVRFPDLPGGPLTGVGLRRSAAELAGQLGVGWLLKPRDRLRVRSCQVPAGMPGEPLGDLLGSGFRADLELVAAALHDRDGGPGPAAAAFLRGVPAAGWPSRVDVRREPLAVRDGCAPDRIPAGRWVADDALVLSEQFAVNEIMTRLAGSGGLYAVHAPPGTGTSAVFGDLIAAIVVERARRLADLRSPHAAFGGSLAWEGHTVAAPVPAVTGFEIVLAGPDGDGVADSAGPRWRERADQAGYFASTARLVRGGDAWGLITAPLGDRARRRAFTERFWHGAAHGTEALFPAGETMPVVLRRLAETAVDWPGAVASFRAALARVTSLGAERAVASAAIARISSLEHALEDAATSLDAALDRCAALAGREPAAAAAVVAAEDRRCAALAALAARRTGAKGARRGVAAAVRAGRDWLASLAALRAAAADATRRRDTALREAQQLRARLADARRTAAQARETAMRLTAQLAALQEPVAAARRRWGDHVPDGPSQEETDDAALIERREKSAAWADEEYATARTELFLAALALHKALITAEAETFERNLGALMDMLAGDWRPPAGPATAAVWQSFFLVVPVVAVTFGSAGALLAGLGRGSLGWLLAERTGQVPPQQLLGSLWRAHRAVLAGDPVQAGPAGAVDALPRDGQRALLKALEVDEEWAPGRTCAQRLADRLARHGTWLPAEAPDGAARLWVGTPLRVQRQLDRPVADLCNEIGYDGLLVCGTPDREPFPGSDGWLDVRPGTEREALGSVLTALREAGVPGAEVRLACVSREMADAAARVHAAVFGETGAEDPRTRAGARPATGPTDVVVLVLGGDPGRPGARAWAASAPNLLSSAVSRARRRLYVVGDRKAWTGQPNSEVLARRLPPGPAGLPDRVRAALDDGDEAGPLRVGAAGRVVVHGAGREVHHESGFGITSRANRHRNQNPRRKTRPARASRCRRGSLWPARAFPPCGPCR